MRKINLIILALLLSSACVPINAQKKISDQGSADGGGIGSPVVKPATSQRTEVTTSGPVDVESETQILTGLLNTPVTLNGLTSASIVIVMSVTLLMVLLLCFGLLILIAYALWLSHKREMARMHCNHPYLLQKKGGDPRLIASMKAQIEELKAKNTLLEHSKYDH